MSILGRINSGQIEITVDVWHSAEYNKDPIGKTEAREKTMQLLKLGAEAEKAVKRCCLYTEDCRNIKHVCFLQEVCKMVREGSK